MRSSIQAQSGVCIPLSKGQKLKVFDMHGEQVSDLFCVDKYDHSNYFSANRTLDYNDSLMLTKGHQLYSNSSDVLMTILEDSCGTHDLLMPPCSLKMFQIVAGDNQYHPSCHENLVKSLADHDVPESFVSTTFNIFMNVFVDPSGKLEIKSPKSKPGDYILFQAERDLLVGLTACSHEQTNNGRCKPIEYQIM